MFKEYIKAIAKFSSQVTLHLLSIVHAPVLAIDFLINYLRKAPDGRLSDFKKRIKQHGGYTEFKVRSDGIIRFPLLSILLPGNFDLTQGLYKHTYLTKGLRYITFFPIVIAAIAAHVVGGIIGIPLAAVACGYQKYIKPCFPKRSQNFGNGTSGYDNDGYGNGRNNAKGQHKQARSKKLQQLSPNNGASSSSAVEYDSQNLNGYKNHQQADAGQFQQQRMSNTAAPGANQQNSNKKNRWWKRG